MSSWLLWHQLKSYFEKYGIGDLEEGDALNGIIDGLMWDQDLDTNDFLTEEEFPKYQHTEL